MLKIRIVTAIIALVILGAVLFVLPPAVSSLVIAFLVLAGAWEWSGFLGLSATTGRYLYVVLIGGLMAIVVFVFPDRFELVLY